MSKILFVGKFFNLHLGHTKENVTDGNIATETSVDNEDITIALTLIATIVAVIAISSIFIIWCCPGCVENSTRVVMEIISKCVCV